MPLHTTWVNKFFNFFVHSLFTAIHDNIKANSFYAFFPASGKVIHNSPILAFFAYFMRIRNISSFRILSAKRQSPKLATKITKKGAPILLLPPPARFWNIADPRKSFPRHPAKPSPATRLKPCACPRKNARSKPPFHPQLARLHIIPRRSSDTFPLKSKRKGNNQTAMQRQQRFLGRASALCALKPAWPWYFLGRPGAALN